MQLMLVRLRILEVDTTISSASMPTIIHNMIKYQRNKFSAKCTRRKIGPKFENTPYRYETHKTCKILLYCIVALD